MRARQGANRGVVSGCIVAMSVISLSHVMLMQTRAALTIASERLSCAKEGKDQCQDRGRNKPSLTHGNCWRKNQSVSGERWMGGVANEAPVKPLIAPFISLSDG